MKLVAGLATVGVATIVAIAPVGAQIVAERADLGIARAIREEGLDRSQIPELGRYLTEVIGPRLTGSPGMKRANEWTAEKFRDWGLVNVSVEPWGEFGRGWERDYYAGRILTPFVQPLHAQPIAWTGSTSGTATGPAMVIQAETVEDLERYRGKLSDAWVLMREMREIEPDWESADRRLSLERLLAPPPEPRERQRPRNIEELRARFRRMRELRTSIAAIIQEEGAAGIITPSSRGNGVLDGGGGAGRDPESPIPMPQLAITREQYNFIYRNVEAGVPVSLEIDVRNKFFEDDLQAYNTLGDIPGSDKADEYVMIGAHLDSWHMGGGATDNGAGSIVMMEAMRILKAVGAQPRRTIRVALWSGEEQGLLGSRAWVANHPELHDAISVYLNVDNGTGRIRGMRTQGNEAAMPIFEQILFPYRDIGVVVVNDAVNGGTDHLSFDRVGIPGFNFWQDPIEYSQKTHHTFLDTYDHLVLDDLKQAAVVVAYTAYHLAMREEMVPRKQEDRPATF